MDQQFLKLILKRITVRYENGTEKIHWRKSPVQNKGRQSYKVVRKQCHTVKKTETICTQKMSKWNI